MCADPNPLTCLSCPADRHAQRPSADALGMPLPRAAGHPRQATLPGEGQGGDPVPDSVLSTAGGGPGRE